MPENTLVTPTIIAHELAMSMENNMVLGGLVNREFQNEFHKVGETINIQKPNVFEVVEGWDISNKKGSVQEQTVPLVLDTPLDVNWEWSAKDYMLTVDQYSKKYIQPAGEKLANAIDVKIASRYEDFFNCAGTAGVTPGTFKAVGSAGKKLTKLGVPMTNRRLVLDPDASLEIADGLKGLNLPSTVKPAVEEGFVGKIARMECYEDQNIRYHTKGVASGTPLVNGNNQTGESLVTNGWTASQAPILKKGDVFTIAGVNSVNAISGDDTGDLQQFVVTAAVNSDSSGNATISISPSIITSGAKKTVTASPVTGAVITVVGSHRANMAFHRDAITLASVPIQLPPSVPAESKARLNVNGFSFLITRYFNGDTFKETIRVDVLIGIKTVEPRAGCRLLG